MFSKVFSALLVTALAVSASPVAPLEARQGGGGGSLPGGSQCFNGPVTFYDPNGGFGACGSPLQNGDFIVALGPGQWDGGSHCGQTVNVQYRGQTIQVVVQDFCPGCQANGIDLSEGAIAGLDPNYINDGVLSAVWCFA